MELYLRMLVLLSLLEHRGEIGGCDVGAIEKELRECALQCDPPIDVFDT
jgi:hypothetical protein